MNIKEAIQHHRQICDELYDIALEENRFLQENRRPPDARAAGAKARGPGQARRRD
jgi:hypothetical protein